MNIRVVCVGNIKEQYLKDAILEYSKRLSKYCVLNIVELQEEKISTENDSYINIAKHKEGERIINTLSKNDFNILLDISATNLNSIEFSNIIQNNKDIGKNITFIIGGSYGVSDEVRNSVDYKISFSKLTFPHQLFRVLLLEQIYRSFKIINNEKYHK